MHVFLLCWGECSHKNIVAYVSDKDAIKWKEFNHFTIVIHARLSSDGVIDHQTISYYINFKPLSVNSNQF